MARRSDRLHPFELEPIQDLLRAVAAQGRRTFPRGVKIADELAFGVRSLKEIRCVTVFACYSSSSSWQSDHRRAPWCQSGFEAFRTPPSQTLGLRAAMEQAMVLSIDIYTAFLDCMGFFNSIIRQVQRRCEAHLASSRGSLTSLWRCTRQPRHSSRRRKGA